MDLHGEGALPQTQLLLLQCLPHPQLWMGLWEYHVTDRSETPQLPPASAPETSCSLLSKPALLSRACLLIPHLPAFPHYYYWELTLNQAQGGKNLICHV